MSDPSIKRSTPSDVYMSVQALGRKIPAPEEIFLTPPDFVQALVELGRKIRKTGAWWAVGGDTAESLVDVHVRPSEIEILTNLDGLAKIFEIALPYNPTPIAPYERQLDREAEPDDKKYPVFVKSMSTEFVVNGAKVRVHGDYQIKVGEWDWGDPLYFEPASVNVTGEQIPLMPLRLKSEMYISLGWMDRASLISEATERAHAYVRATVGGGQAPG